MISLCNKINRKFVIKFFKMTKLMFPALIKYLPSHDSRANQEKDVIEPERLPTRQTLRDIETEDIKVIDFEYLFSVIHINTKHKHTKSRAVVFYWGNISLNRQN